jgi:hypothetical protein
MSFKQAWLALAALLWLVAFGLAWCLMHPAEILQKPEQPDSQPAHRLQVPCPRPRCFLV